MVKEATGHRSDAVDAYQVTSDAQRSEMSTIIACLPVSTVSSDDSKSVNSDVSEVSKADEKCKINVCKCQEGTSNVGDIIEKIVKARQG